MLAVVAVVLVREVPPEGWEPLAAEMELLEITALRQLAALPIQAGAVVVIQAVEFNPQLAMAAPASLSFVTQQTLTPRHQ
jgi:hypothetical protein